jgi:hypothetical protein
MQTQPVTLVAIAGAALGYQRPKARRVVALFEMRQLVDHDVIEHAGWRQEEAPVEVEVALSRATAPPALLIADGNAPEAEAVVRIPVGDTLGKYAPSLPPIPGFEGGSYCLRCAICDGDAQLAFVHRGACSRASTWRLEHQSQIPSGERKHRSRSERSRDNGARRLGIAYEHRCNPARLFAHHRLDPRHTDSRRRGDLQPVARAHLEAEPPGAGTDAMSVGDRGVAKVDRALADWRRNWPCATIRPAPGHAAG